MKILGAINCTPTASNLNFQQHPQIPNRNILKSQTAYRHTTLLSTKVLLGLGAGVLRDQMCTSYGPGKQVRSLRGAVADKKGRYTLHPTPYTLHPTPYTPHPSPFTLHHSPSILALHPKPSTLNPSGTCTSRALWGRLSGRRWPRRRGTRRGSTSTPTTASSSQA